MSGNSNSGGGCLIPMALIVGGILYLAFEHPLALIPIFLIVMMFIAWIRKK